MALAWFRMLDLAVALAVTALHWHGMLSVLLCSWSFHYDAPSSCRQSLYMLRQQAQLAFITGLPNDFMGWKCIWVLIFASREVKERMISPGRRALEFLVWS